MFDLAFFTDVGLKRKHNEDSMLIDKKTATFIIADGMGGHAKGEIASKVVVESFIDASNKNLSADTVTGIDDEDTLIPSNAIEGILNDNIKKASKQLQIYANEKNIKGTIGSTIVGIKYIISIQAWILFHLGDSRAYLFRSNALRQLTRDHSRYEELKKKNMSEEDIAKSGRNVITKAIGNFSPFPLEIQYITTQKEDILFLCSDGVSDLCTHDELLILFIQYQHNLSLLSAQIKQLVYSRGAGDNLSVILLKIQ